MSTFDWRNDNELYHYGVLGMKWGIRKYQNPDGTLTAAGKKRYLETGEKGYVYKSHATKKYDRKAAKAAAKGNTEKAEKFKQRADISRQIDARELNYAKSVKAIGNIVTRTLTGGGFGGKAYQMHMAMNSPKMTTGSKAASTILAYSGHFLLGSIFSVGDIGARARKAMVIRSNENTLLGKAGRQFGGNNLNYANKQKYIKDEGIGLNEAVRRKAGNMTRG